MSSVPADPPLREIHGPSAIGGGRRRFLELLWLISLNEFKRTYFGTVLGYFWSLVRPLLLFGVLLLVFTKVFRLGSGVPNYPVLLLLNIVLFTLVQEATSAAVTSIVGNEGIVRKTQFPRLVIPLSIVLTSALQPRPEPDRGFRVHLHLRRRSPLDLAAAAGAARAAAAADGCAVDAALGAVRPLSRRRDHLVGRRHRALLRDADPLPDRGRPQVACGRSSCSTR